METYILVISLGFLLLFTSLSKVTLLIVLGFLMGFVCASVLVRNV